MFRPLLRCFPSPLPQRGAGGGATTHQPSSIAFSQFRSISSAVVPSASSSCTSSSSSLSHSSSSLRRKQQQPTNAIHPSSNQAVRFRSNRSRRGLYDGKDIRSGNNVSFSMKATKRTFKPNVFVKRIYSSILDSMIPFHLTASTLRSIDKAGGLDTYLLNNRSIVEGEGLTIKKKILSRLKNQHRMARKEAERTAAAATLSSENP